MDMWFVFLTLILLTRFSQRGSLVSGGGQRADHMPRGCRRLISISKSIKHRGYIPGIIPIALGHGLTEGRDLLICAALCNGGA